MPLNNDACESLPKINEEDDSNISLTFSVHDTSSQGELTQYHPHPSMALKAINNKHICSFLGLDTNPIWNNLPPSKTKAKSHMV